MYLPCGPEVEHKRWKNRPGMFTIAETISGAKNISLDVVTFFSRKSFFFLFSSFFWQQEICS